MSELVAKASAFEVVRVDGKLIARCACGSREVVVDKGMGRAVIGAWKSRHRNCPPPPPPSCEACGVELSDDGACWWCDDGPDPFPPTPRSTGGETTDDESSDERGSGHE